jgi:hypothetical protein
LIEKSEKGDASQRRVLRIHDAISMAYDRLMQISAKDYHNKIPETKETSHSCVTLHTRKTGRIPSSPEVSARRSLRPPGRP